MPGLADGFSLDINGTRRGNENRAFRLHCQGNALHHPSENDSFQIIARGQLVGVRVDKSYIGTGHQFVGREEFNLGRGSFQLIVGIFIALASTGVGSAFLGGGRAPYTPHQLPFQRVHITERLGENAGG